MSRKSKMKELPSVVPKTVEERGYVSERRSYKLITPLYGGGVEPENSDPITVVRASEVRGHLRFWWRATRGGAFDGSLEKMREREEEIFGSAAGKYPDGTKKPGASKVNIQVVDIRPGKAEPAFTVIDTGQKNKYGKPKTQQKVHPKVAEYAAFPLMPEKDELKIIGWKSENIHFDVTFGLYLMYPEQYKLDIEAALWAWETFGGIGARTRRGFGAPQRTDQLAEQTAEDLLKDGLKTHVTQDGKWPTGVPHLNREAKSENYKITSQKSDETSAWKHLIATLQYFRQTTARYDKESGEPSDYGMSRWPEANEIRRFYGRNPALPKDVYPKDLVEKFPRAKFGLPIVFHMAHDDGLKQKIITIQGNKYERLASPLILRPLICKDGGTVGLAVILEWDTVDSEEVYTPPQGLRVTEKPQNEIKTIKEVKSGLEKHEAKKIPMLDGETDILKAFLDYLN